MTKPIPHRVLPAAIAVVVGCSLLGGGAQAQMRSPDLNGDGIVTPQEQADQSEARFKRMDRNGDGVIDAGELARIKQFMAMRSPCMASKMDNLDANHDGQITHEEFMASSKARFALMDANHDGKLDKAELDAAKVKLGCS